MKSAPLTLAFISWGVASLLVDAILLLCDRPELLRLATRLRKISQWLLGAVILIVIAEGSWQEILLQFSPSPTAIFTTPIQDHGTKYVTPNTAAIIGLFRQLFPLIVVPFLAVVIGDLALRGGRRKEEPDFST